MVGIGLATALLGALFFGLMLRSFLRAGEMRKWPEVPCVILVSEIEQRRHDPHSPVEARHVVSFGYEWEGQPRTSGRLSLRGSPWSSKAGVTERRVAAYPVGMRTTCWVKPDEPDFAVLQLDSLAPGYSIWFPALFVIGGLGIVVRSLRQPRKKSPAA
jgi:hypothetical protein